MKRKIMKLKIDQSFNWEDRQGFHSFRGHAQSSEQGGKGEVHWSGVEEDEYIQDGIKTIHGEEKN